MRKLLAYVSMLAIAAAIVGADLWILVRGGALGAYARRELDRLTGGACSARDIRVSLDGRILLEGVEVAAGKVRAFQAGRVEVELTGGRPSRAVLRDVRLRLSDALFEELGKGEPSKTTIKDVFPTPDLPRIEIDGGTVELDLGAVLAPGRPLGVTLGRITAAATDGYRAHFEAAFESPLLGAWTAAGEADLETGAYRLRMSTEGWQIRPALREALAAGPRDIFDKYKPAGKADLHVEISKAPGKGVDFTARFRPRGMSIYYRNFPYPIERVEGELDFFADGFRIKHMEARSGGTGIRFDGWADGYDAAAAYAFRVEIDDMPLDALLRSALGADAQRVWDLFGPSGRATARGRVLRKRGADEKESIPLDITLADAAMTYKNFPYPVKGLNGELFFDGDDAVVKRLRAKQGATTLEISGSVRDITADPEVDLRIDAETLPLDARLRDALPPKPRETYDSFRPAGPVDLRWWVRKAKGKEVETGGRARALGNAVTWKEIPLPAIGLTGEIELDGAGKVTLRHLLAKVVGAEIEIHGTVTDEMTSLHVDAAGLPLDADVKAALPASLKKVVEALKLVGTVSFNSALKIKAGGETQADVVLRLTKAAIETDPRFEDLEGTVSLASFTGETSLMQGSVSFSRAAILGKRLTDVTASFNLNGPRLNFVNIKAAAYGGQITGESFGLDIDTGVFFGRLFTIDRLNLAEFAKDTGGFKQKALAGRASLELRDLQGTAGDGASMSGTGRLRVLDAAMWDVPIFLSVFQLNPQDLFKGKNVFEAGAIDFEIKGKKFAISKLAFTSETSSIVGHGRVNFDGDLHLYLRPHSGRLLGLDFFIFNWTAEFLGLFTGALMGVEVTGTFEKPETTIKPFQGFR
ncbi:MAG TPA: AsmA-like C-terminal region-containing protein [Planctomycetota bacterium]